MTPEQIRDAADAVSKADHCKSVLNPALHATELEAAAPELAGVLRRSQLTAIAEEFHRKDALAQGFQKEFQTTAGRANMAVLLSACLSALILAVAPLKAAFPGVPDKAAVAVLGALGVVAGAFASWCLSRLREGRMLDAWLAERASAESLRREYFDAAIQPPPQPVQPPGRMLLLQFEYFRLCQLDVQIEYYTRRAGEQRTAAAGTTRLGGFAVFTATVATGLVTALSSMHTGWTTLAALASMSTALAAWSTAREAILQSRRNSELYGKALESLLSLKRRLDEVRLAAAQNEREPVLAFIAAVHEPLAAEHREWLKAADAIRPALAKLDAALAKLKLPPDVRRGTLPLQKESA